MKLTQEGLDKLHIEKEALLQERVTVIEDVKKSREMGDLSENGYYKASKSRLRFIDGQLFRIGMILKTSSLIQKPQGEVISLGSTVTIQSSDAENTYLLVDKLEADPKNGKVSYHSPLGEKLMGKHLGDKITVATPRGEIVYTIKKVD
jgi:transcription elongation factor GreA